MKLILSQQELEQAIKMFVNQMVQVKSQDDIQIEFKAGRGENGTTAEIDVSYVGVTSIAGFNDAPTATTAAGAEAASSTDKPATEQTPPAKVTTVATGAKPAIEPKAPPKPRNKAPLFDSTPTPVVEKDPADISLNQEADDASAIAADNEAAAEAELALQGGNDAPVVDEPAGDVATAEETPAVVPDSSTPRKSLFD